METLKIIEILRTAQYSPTAENIVQAMYDALVACEKLANIAICALPTGSERTKLTEINIQRMVAIDAARRGERPRGHIAKKG